jgi:DivIVA domain-containing protein
VVDTGSSKADVGAGRAPRAPGREQEHGFRDLRHYVPADILDVSFPVSVRGYDRHAVDDHIKRVNRVIAELKVSASPPAAVRHALDQAQEKVDSLLAAARDAAEEITTSARQEADERMDRAKAQAAELVVNTSADADRMRAEADELVAKATAEADDMVAKAKAEADQVRSAAKDDAENTRTRSEAEADERRRRLEEELAAQQERAETRLGEIESDTEAIRGERGRLLDDIHALANGLVKLADAAAMRLPTRDAAEPEAETPEPEGRDDQPPPAATEEVSRGG